VRLDPVDRRGYRGQGYLRKEVSQNTSTGAAGSKMDGTRTAVYNRVKGLYAATEHLRCFGDVGDITSK
jgi:hypothetical protein